MGKKYDKQRKRQTGSHFKHTNQTMVVKSTIVEYFKSRNRLLCPPFPF